MFVLRTAHRSIRIPVRTLAVRTVLVGAILLIGTITLMVGTFMLTPADIVGVLDGSAPEAVRKLVVDWRLPRALFAIAAGVALGVSGAVFQSLTRNPLGSPDVIGFDAGAYTGAITVMLLFHSTSYLHTAVGAIAGGVLTAAAVFALAYRRGVQGFRFIIVGIGVAAFLTAANNTLLISSEAEQARSAVAWGFGSFSALGFTQLVPFTVALLVLLPIVAVCAGTFTQLELGDDAATALGVRVEGIRGTMTGLGVALTALVTAAAGPIAFIALVAPQLARRATRARGLDLVTAGLMGAVLLLAADFVGGRFDLSVGLVTVVLGGGWFLWLLIRETRSR